MVLNPSLCFHKQMSEDISTRLKLAMPSGGQCLKYSNNSTLGSQQIAPDAYMY